MKPYLLVSKKNSKKFIDLYEKSPLYVMTDHDKLIIVHAGIVKIISEKPIKKLKHLSFMAILQAQSIQTARLRWDWAQDYNGEAWIVYGHTPVKEARQVQHTFNIDTGCVFGGKLRTLSLSRIQINLRPFYYALYSGEI